MEHNLNISTYELVNSYDKLILKKQNELQKYFFENVKQEDMTGDIELPLVYNEDSDYAKLRRIKPEITKEAQLLEKMINEPSKYLIGEVRKGLELEVEKVKKKKEKIDTRLNAMNEEPKLFLRYYELRNSDFSAVKDEKVRNKLHEMQEEIDEYRRKRNAIFSALKDFEEESSVRRKK